MPTTTIPTLTPEQAALTALAGQVLAARMSRALMADSGHKGRVFITIPGPPTAAEVAWDAMLAPITEARRAAREALTAVL